MSVGTGRVSQPAPSPLASTAMEEIGIHLGGCRLRAVRHGEEGQPLVLCGHGLSVNARAFDTLAAHIAPTGRQVVALDFRGRGLSAVTPPGSYGLETHAADVLAAASALGAQTFDYIGWSMGALIGILAAGRATGRLRRLVLIDHAGRMDDDAVRVVRAGLDRLDASVTDPTEHVEAVRAAGGIEHWAEQWDAVHRRELERAQDGRWVARTSRSACEEDLEDMIAREEWNRDWRRLTMPTLLIRSTRPIEGGFIVPEDQRDGLAADARDVTVVEVDATHSDLMTADAALAATDSLLD